MSAPRRTVYPDRLQFRVPPDIREALERGATAARCGSSEFARRVLLAGLQAQGVLPAVEA